MNIHQFSQRFKISMRKAREMEKAGALKLDPIGSDNAADIRGTVLRGNPLTAMMLLRLVEAPDLIDAIGGKPEIQVREAIAALDGAPAAPREVAAGLMESAFGEPGELARLIDWLCAIIPDKPVSHAYVAVRLLRAWPVAMREKMLKPINSALGHARRSEKFAGWSRLDKSGARSAVIYQRPKNSLDL
jgi:hypothetical protein